MALCLACASCESDAIRRGPEARPTLAPCSALVGRWREVEPVDGTYIDEPEDGKVRPISPGTWLTIEPHRLTVESATERAESSAFVEPAATGACLLHARDSLGRPLDVEAALIREHLLRMHNIAEPRSPSTLYERQ
jgi:hypothetical protein